MPLHVSFVQHSFGGSFGFSSDFSEVEDIATGGVSLPLLGGYTTFYNLSRFFVSYQIATSIQ